jgi:hypothetical protein
LLLFVFLLSAIAFCADTHTAASCSQEHVQAAINAASDGDIVQVPAGACTWTTLAPYTPSVRISGKAIILQGAGTEPTGTIITDGTHDWHNEVPLFVQATAGKPIRITNIAFYGNTDIKGMVSINGVCADFRMDHCKFEVLSSGNGIFITGPFTGVFDHCVFISHAGFFKAFQTSAAVSGETENGETAWQRPLALGSGDAIFMEDCLFEYAYGYALIDADEGTRFVFRNNTVHNSQIGTHGHDGEYKHRSVLSYEIYANAFSATVKPNLSTIVALRGGTGTIFNNSFAGNYNVALSCYCYCACKDNPTCTAWPQCTYPCPDQVGRGPDTNHDSAQELEPLYHWGNAFGGIYQYVWVNPSCSEVSDVIKKDRDYYEGIFRPNYVPYPYPHPLILGDYPGQQRSLDLSATPAGGQINLTWKAVTGAVSYSILRNWQQVLLVTGTSWSDSTPGSKPVYMVYALDGSGKILAAEGKVISAVPQSVSLASGWNWVSFNVLPTDLSLNSVFSGILDKIEQVKTQTQSAMRSGGNWKGDLADMNGIGQYKMYKVKVNAACTLTVTGTAVLSANPIPLGGGWNWVAFLPTTAMPIATALDSIKGQVLEVKSRTQSATYNGSSWSGSLTQLEPGQGYAIKMSGPGTLTYLAAASTQLNQQGRAQ